MVDLARLAVPQESINQMEFMQGSTEELSMLSDSSVDLVIAGLFSQPLGGGRISHPGAYSAVRSLVRLE